MKTTYLEHIAGNKTELDKDTYAPTMPYYITGTVSASQGNNYILNYNGSGVFSCALQFRAPNLEYYCTFDYAATSINGTVTKLVEHKFVNSGNITCNISVNSSGNLVINFSALPTEVTLQYKILKWF